MPWLTQETAPVRGAMEEYTPVWGDNPMVEMRALPREAAKRIETGGQWAAKPLTPDEAPG